MKPRPVMLAPYTAYPPHHPPCTKKDWTTGYVIEGFIEPLFLILCLRSSIHVVMATVLI